MEEYTEQTHKWSLAQSKTSIYYIYVGGNIHLFNTQEFVIYYKWKKGIIDYWFHQPSPSLPTPIIGEGGIPSKLDISQKKAKMSMNVPLMRVFLKIEASDWTAAA